MDKIISIDLKADFGFLKKPDTNKPIYLTFNMLHKPTLLGIFGAIVGLGGFSESKKEDKKSRTDKDYLLPEYYNMLISLKVGIKPLGDEKGNFEKTIIQYNNGVGYANLDGGNLIVVEQTLIKPSYRCYFLVESELHEKLSEYLEHNKAEFLPYLGKNDFSVWWDNFQEHKAQSFKSPNKSFKLESIFIKEETLKDGVKKQQGFKPKPTANSKFMYFENLPVNYDTRLMQYNYKSFAYTDWDLQQEYEVNNLYQLENGEIIQLF